MQIDLCIAVASVERLINSEESDDDDEDDYDDIALEVDVDPVGDVRVKLKAANRIYADMEMKEEDHIHDDSIGLLTTKLQSIYKQFRVQLAKADKTKHAFNADTFPQHRRFGIFVDRRQCNNKDRGDEIIFFEQIERVSTIPSDYVPEWMINAARECLIPGTDDDEKDEVTKSIGAMEHCRGQLLSFNFQVEAQEEKRAYMIWNGQTS